MAKIFQDGEIADPSKLPEGTRYDPARGPVFGWVNQEGKPENEFIGTSEDDPIEVRDGKWALVSGEREK